MGVSYLDVVKADRPYLLWPLDEGGGSVARDLSGNGRAGTYTGTPAKRAGPSFPGGAAPRFGTSKYVEVASVTLGASFAVECWFEKVTHLGGFPGDINNLIGDLYTTSNGVLVRWDSTTTLRLYYAAGGFQTITASGLTLPSHRRPHHLVASVRSGGRARLIIDGTVVADAATVGTPSGMSGAFPVGGESLDGRNFDGSIGWAAAYTNEITPGQAKRHWQAGLREVSRRGPLR